MVLSNAKELGKTLAGQQRQIDELKQVVKPNDPNATFPLFTTETFKVTKTVEIYKSRMTGVYIVGHPTYGQIGDGGLLTMPVTMPIEFTAEVPYPVGPICILDHSEWAFLDDCILGDRDTDQYERTLMFSGTL